MASEKKAPEGIALFSIYGDEDDEMEDVDAGEESIQPPASDSVAVNAHDGVGDYSNGNSPRQQRERGLNYGNSLASAGLPLSLLSPQRRQSRKRRLTLVDYGHGEGAMSPEAEEGEIAATGRVMYEERLQCSDGESREKKSPKIARLPTPTPNQAITLQPSDPADQPESDAMSYAVNQSESAGTEDAVMAPVEEQRDDDPLDKFLPPPPKAKCSRELQEKIIKFLDLKKTTGRSFNAEIRKRKEYRNSDFLLRAATYQDIDQVGSCFSKDVFDPHGYDKSDFYDVPCL